MSLLFADIFEAIRAIRVCKGTTEKDIMNYVQERVGGCLRVENRYPLFEVVQAIDELRQCRGLTNKQVCDYVRKQGRNPNDPMKGKNYFTKKNETTKRKDTYMENVFEIVLKTIRTLNKLVEDGVLIKRGRRYLFPPRPPKNGGDDGGVEEGYPEDCEEEEENRDGNDEEVDDDDDCANEEESANDDDDEDDDEEEDEEDEDDDDDDDDCKEKEKKPENITVKSEPNTTGPGAPKSHPPNMGGTCPNSNINSNNRPSKPGNNGPNVPGNNSDKHNKNIKTASKMKTTFKNGKGDLELAKLLMGKNRPSKGGKNLITKKDKKRSYRSRSPIKRHKVDQYHSLKLDQSHIPGLEEFQNQIFQDSTDADMDIDNGLSGVDYDLYRQKSTVRSPEPSCQNSEIENKESNSSNYDKKLKVKLEPSYHNQEESSLKNYTESKSLCKQKSLHNKKMFREGSEKVKEKIKRDMSEENHRTDRVDSRRSICSACEKKKKNS